jgi:hypothetical protein
MSNNYYFYRMTTDNGGAPCVQDGLWSLAICKPRIRKSASEGDIVLGLAGNGIDKKNGVIHVARVTAKLLPGTYYSDSSYVGRHDRVYEQGEHGWRWVPGSRFHGPSFLDHDIGEDGQRGYVLISKEFRYFGSRFKDRNQPFAVDWSRFLNLHRVLENLKQGERVHHSPEVRHEIEILVQELLESTNPQELGQPGHEEDCPCDRDDDCEVVCGRECE